MNFLISFREFWRQKGPLLLFVLSLVFSLGVFVALDSVQINVTNYINQEKKSLVGGDIKISSNRSFSKTLKAILIILISYNKVIFSNCTFRVQRTTLSSYYNKGSPILLFST